MAILNFSEREAMVEKIFGLTQEQRSTPIIPNINLSLSKPGLTYITGYSGSGKSSLLREISRKNSSVLINEVKLPDSKKVIDCFETDVASAIQWLSCFGLGEARVLTTKVEVLSVGQKERLRLAILLWEKPKAILLDEFLSSLDRLTAKVIAFQFQKLIRKFGITCIVATAHDDLEEALFPDLILKLDLGGKVYRKENNYSENELKNKKLPELQQIVIEEGTIADYNILKCFHYMDQQIGEKSLVEEDIVSIRRAVFQGKVVGVRVFTKIFPSYYEKVGIFKFVNEKAVLSSRVIVHPAFRGLGLSGLLDFKKNEKQNFRAIFSHSALAKYFPFDITSGYQTFNHPSELKTEAHIKFENYLKECGLDEIEKINDTGFCEKFWIGLLKEQQSFLRKNAEAVLIDYDLRYLVSILEALHFKMPLEAQNSLKTFFKAKLDGLSFAKTWQILSEALHFPMLGVVRYLK